MNLIESDIQFRHAIEVLHRYTEHIIFIISIMTDIKRSIKIFLLNFVFQNFKYQSSNDDFKSLISICSFITMRHAMFFEVGKMSSRLLVFVIFAFDFFIRIYYQRKFLKKSSRNPKNVLVSILEKLTFLGQTLSSSLQNSRRLRPPGVICAGTKTPMSTG